MACKHLVMASFMDQKFVYLLIVCCVALVYVQNNIGHNEVISSSHQPFHKQ